MFEHKILLASDFTPTSEAAEGASIQLARKLGIQLVIVHVVLERSTHGMSTVPPELADLELLNQKLQALGSSEMPNAERVLAHGRPAETIVRIAEEKSVDLIVMGTQGRTGINRAVLGSVAEEVARHVSLPVMLVKSATNR